MLAHRTHRTQNQLVKTQLVSRHPPLGLEQLTLSKLHLCPKPATITFANFDFFRPYSICQLPVPLLPLSCTPNLITVILSMINALSLHYPISRWSRILLLVLSLKVLSYHSYPTLFALAQDHWTHRIQAPLTYLQSSHNYPTSIPL